MKKFISAIFSIYFAFLSINACTDMETSSCELGHSIESFTHIDDNEHEHEDGCSPLCYCICCNSPITVSSKTLSFSFLYKIDIIPQLFFNTIENPIEPSWQPPEAV